MKHCITVAIAALMMATSCQKSDTTPNAVAAKGQKPSVAQSARQTGSYKWGNFTVHYYVGVPYRQHIQAGPMMTDFYGDWQCLTGSSKCAYNVTTDWRSTGTPTSPTDGRAFDALHNYLTDLNGKCRAIVWADESNYYMLHMRTDINSGIDVFTCGDFVSQSITPIAFPDDGFPHMITAGSYRVMHTTTSKATYAVSVIPADSVKAAPDAIIVE